MSRLHGQLQRMSQQTGGWDMSVTNIVNEDIHWLLLVSCKKTSFYCVNTSYPMDKCFTGRRDRSRQTSEKDVLYIIPAGPARRVHSPGGASYFLFLSRQRDVIVSFSFGAWRVKTCFYDKRIFCSTPNSTFLIQRYFL